MPAASILIKPTSANCNMDCKYCFYKCLSSNREKYSLGFMSEATLASLIKNAITYGEDYLTFAFQGGEPTLAGLPFFKKAVALQQKYLTEEICRVPSKRNMVIENTIQTNGLLLDDEWADFFHENHFLVGISLDGPRKIHDYGRVDAAGNGTFERLMHAISILKKHKVDYNILTVITEETAQKASTLYKFYKRNDFRYVQLIPCMDEVGRNQSSLGKSINSNPYAVTAKQYGIFLKEFFDLWYEDFKRGDIMDVRMFSNWAQMTVGYPPEECGMCGSCKCYFVVEGDGSVYPCDFYAFGDNKLGTVQDSFEQLIHSEKVKLFEEKSQRVETACQCCEHFALCRGGCRRWREQGETNQLGINYLCEGYHNFFDHAKERLYKLGRTIVDPTARRFL